MDSFDSSELLSSDFSSDFFSFDALLDDDDEDEDDVDVDISLACCGVAVDVDPAFGALVVACSCCGCELAGFCF